MTTHQARPLSRADAEKVLTGTASPPAELAHIIAAARGLADSDELAGEAAAMIRFQAARLEPAAAHAPTVRKRTSDKLLAAKLGIAAALAAAATGGVALAAAAHTQTEPAHDASACQHTGSRAESLTERLRRKRPPLTAPAPSHAATASAPPPAPAGGAGSHPSASRPRLRSSPRCAACASRTSPMGRSDGKVIDTPAFRALVTAAGGRGKVTAYCQMRCSVLVPIRPARRGATRRAADLPAP